MERSNSEDVKKSTSASSAPSAKAHIPNHTTEYVNPFNGESWTIFTFLYDLSIFIFNIIFTIFFREIKVRGTYNVPSNGTPTILVCAPHANQFIDPTLVMTTTRKLMNGRSRQSCFVTAESSFKYKVVGFFSKCLGSIPVPRIQDNLKPVDANIQIFAPDRVNEPTLIKGCCKDGSSPKFTKLFTEKSLIGLPKYQGNAQISKILDDETIILTSPFKSEAISTPTNFNYAPRVDNTKTFQYVFDHLHTKGCVGIFPEGGSHDRPSLLPIKAGVAIMALGAAAADPSMNVSVVPVGLHYFHRQKFRSRAVVEYGEPIIVNHEMGLAYANHPRETVSKLLDKIQDALFSVTVNAPDYDTLMTIQAVRRLYEPATHKFSLPMILEINRRLLVGYSTFKDEPRIIHLKNAVSKYNDTLYSMNLKDHQVEQLKTSSLETIRCIIVLLTRLATLYLFFILSLPGSVLFTPIFITAHVYSKKKAKEGLKKSLVKIKGVDLLATWKLIVALVLAPLLYTTYSLALVYLFNRNPSNFIVRWIWIPNFIPRMGNIPLFVYFYSLLVLTTYSSLKTGEVGMDLFKSLRPLFVSLFYQSDKIKQLQKMRQNLSVEITNVCNEYGPSVFPDFDKMNFANPENKFKFYNNDERAKSRSRSSSFTSIFSGVSNALSRVNSRGSLSDVPILGYSRLDYTSDTIADDSSDEEDIIDISIRNKDKAESSKITSIVRERWNREHEKND
ncbi:hypothetical protein KAFR_0H00490 [Kazachstania africana CBS 2517]|uniref:Phospholipid/glycerol acyltransferase domain-containing protein n=1 Tax=Kazachstania africana (strain ATCC 22294 / BCRC 22015 / CBS 2517 / CECT 1963 / NBRC 1671 / NRRL Y-8276) TaxID=1071382 RepID=H2AYQ2_KAZAF|nr:hypothetical protein KAFR_0H00490 [Kazachstania africana CBS 2517]CCF59458.1 hypothetical protein KAFR_0H00490 [Kazachstania africana CBS 2517]